MLSRDWESESWRRDLCGQVDKMHSGWLDWEEVVDGDKNTRWPGGGVTFDPVLIFQGRFLRFVLIYRIYVGCQYNTCYYQFKQALEKKRGITFIFVVFVVDVILQPLKCPGWQYTIQPRMGPDLKLDYFGGWDNPDWFLVQINWTRQLDTR